MAKNVHVLKNEARETLSQIARDTFAGAGIDLGQTRITPHLIGSVTVILTDAQLHAARVKIGGWLELTGHGNSGRIEVIFPALREYAKANRPTLTEAEREAKKTEGGGVSREEAEARRKLRAELEAELLSTHGIDLSENKGSEAE